MGKTYAIADLHVGYNWSPEQYGNIWAFQKLVSLEDSVICLGDTFEWVWRKKEETHSTEEYRTFKANSTNRYYFVEGNHDIGSGVGYLALEGKVILKHGHQFDNLADTPWKGFYYRFAPYVRDVWWRSPFQQKQQNRKDWRLHNAFIYSNAVTWMEKNPCKLLIIGHTHDTCVVERPELGKKLVALSSLPEDGIYAEIVAGGVLIMKLGVLLKAVL